LTSAEIADRRNRGLTNTMSDDIGRSVMSIVRANVLTLFNAVVGSCFVLLLTLGAWRDALFGFFVIANTLIGFVQEFHAKRSLARLAVLHAPQVRVRRNGTDATCRRADLVLGDLLVLQPGDQVAADAELVFGPEVEIDTSLLTGEADPVSVVPGTVMLSGSTVISGGGLARIIRVGVNSYAGRITAEARQFSLVKSELRASIARVIRWVTIALIPVGAVLVNGQMQAVGGWSVAFSSGAWRSAAVSAVGGIIAMVPQGLVFMTSVALAVAAVKLARREVLVNELAAVESLARVGILCIDKTGTLTEGQLMLDAVESVGGPVPGWERALGWFAADPAANATARALAEGFGVHGDDSPSPDTTVVFSSAHKWSAAHFSGTTLTGTWVLGGADVVLRNPISGIADQVLARTNALSESGRRTLVLAYSPLPIEPAEAGLPPVLPQPLEPVAVIVLRERIRRDAAETIRYFREEGIDVCVLSGDSPQTVGAIAHEVGITDSRRVFDARVLPSEPEKLASIACRERVFGRITPEQKNDLVIAFQSLGYNVAMLGDGVNDLLALKHADLGIAMGSGSPAARAVADIVLLDNAFARLPGVVTQGRQVIANVERLTKLFLSKTVYALLLGAIFGVLLWPYPFLPRQLSVVDGLTIGLPALVLALLPNVRVYRPGLMRRALRFCVPSGVIVTIAVVSTTAYAYAILELPLAQVQTTAIIALTLSALWVLVTLVRPISRATFLVLVAAYAGLLIVLVVPYSSEFLRLEMPPFHAVMVTVGGAVVASISLEVTRRAMRRSAMQSSH
jgi:cation-transporting ATPase E